MKRLIITVALLVGVSTMNLKAEEKCGAGLITYEEIIISNSKGMKMKVSIKNQQNYKAEIVIKNSNNEVFYVDYTNVDNFNKVFDVSNLPDGNYIFEITMGKEKQTKPFSLKSNYVRQLVQE